MIQWFRSLSINTLAFMAIAAGLAGMMIYDPPKSTCDAEKDNFRVGMVGFFSAGQKSYVSEAPYFRMKENCLRGNGPGACLEFFTGLRKMLRQLSSVSPQCLREIGDLREVKGGLKTGLDLMIRMAWGASPPSHANLKAGWFDGGDLNLFCNLKSTATQIFGAEAWKGFENSYFKDLPGATLLPRSEVWDKSLLSLQCTQYQ